MIVHLAEGGKSHGGIVGGVAVAQCQLRVGIFKIGQVDVDIGGEVAKGFDAVVTTCIVNDGGIEVASVKPFDDGGQIYHVKVTKADSRKALEINLKVEEKQEEETEERGRSSK